VQGIGPGVVLVLVTPDPAVQRRNSNLPVFAELCNSAGAFWTGILPKDSEYERQSIGREGDKDLWKDGMHVIPVTIAGAISAITAFFAKINGNLNGIDPWLSIAGPDKTTGVGTYLPGTPDCLAASFAVMAVRVIEFQKAFSIFKEIQSGLRQAGQIIGRFSLQRVFLSPQC
jgi:hypothetical protein